MQISPGRATRIALWVIGSLAGSTLAVAVLETWVGVPNASAVYLVAVVLCGLRAGTGAAILAAIGAFLVYNYAFTEPRFTFQISDPGVLLSVVLLLFVGIVVGQLAALERSRAEAARAREQEARALFRVSRVLATRSSTDVALAQIAAVLAVETGMDRVWIALGPDVGAEQRVADTSTDARAVAATRFRVLQRRPGDEPAEWSLVHLPSTGGPRQSGSEVYRIRIEASGEPLGSIWASRVREAGIPDREATRLLAGAADQIGQALARDRVATEARAAEIARQSDALKSSLLQSVSHDFRTPLAVIQAAAGSLDAGDEVSAADRHADRLAIEREVLYLNRLVSNLLDLSRIEAGALRADRDIYELDDLVDQAVARTRPRLGRRTLEVGVDPLLVLVDPVFLDAALANVLDNAIKYTPDGATIAITARDAAPDRVRLSIDDDGPGVPDDARQRIFEKFYRAPGAAGGSRGGLGIGLAVVRGLVQAMGGEVGARRELHGRPRHRHGPAPGGRRRRGCGARRRCDRG